MIRDVIVNLGLGEHDPAGEVAVSLGEIFDAHVLGLAFAYEPVIPGAMMGSVPAEFIESQRAEASDMANGTIRRFEELARRSSISRDMRMLSASLSGASDQLGRLSRRFDIVVVGQPEREHGASDEIVAEGALFESARPVIIVPFIHKGGLKLDRVMVCWDGSRAATRAIGDAMPLLERAGRVEIVVVANERGKQDEIEGADMGQHLARLGPSGRIWRRSPRRG
jgi:hypothetical protein